MKCFYHGSDFDGVCSAAIIYQKYGNSCEYIPINYNDKFPFETLKDNELIILVDYSIRPPEEMVTLKNKNVDVIWIDHHSSIIEASKDEQFYFEDMRGIRDEKIAACELTWKYFFNPYNIPYCIKLLSLFDVGITEVDQNILPFQYGLKSEDTRVNSSLWKDLFSIDKESVLLRNILDKGKTITDHYNIVIKSLFKQNGFGIDFHGYKTVAVNTHEADLFSIFSDWYKKDYDILLTFYRRKSKTKKWKVSIRTQRNDIDLSKIASLYDKGGGHKQASGFIIEDINKLFV